MVNQEDMAISFYRHLENKSKKKRKKSKCISQIAKKKGGGVRGLSSKCRKEAETEK